MNSRPLLLAALALGLTAGCNKSPAPAEPAPANEPGTVAQAPAEQKAPPPSEPGSGGTPPAPEAAPAETAKVAVYEVRMSGVRCIAAPCPTHVARPVDDPKADGIQVHEVDLSALNLPEPRVEALNRRMDEGSVKVEATVGTRPNAGPAGAATVLHVKKVVDGQP
ncbi:hypothetical protein P2318_01195 [Myxococcaceae bacterium GXIMD 01537]